MVNNKVLVKVDVFYDNGDYFKTKGGLKIILAGGEWNEAAYVPRFGTVVNIPKKLISRWESEPSGVLNPMQWKTKLEIEIGDIVYWGIMAGANSPVLEVNGDVYFIVDYGDLIMRVRGEEKRGLNGYVLCEEVVEKTRINGLILDFGDFQNKRLGVVKYKSTPNSAYFNSDAFDGEVEVGDTVVLNGSYWTELESEQFGVLGERIGYIQGKWLIAKL